MSAAQSELPYAFACAHCYGTVPLVTVAVGVRLTCAECGHRQEITAEWLERLFAGDGVRPRALLEGLPPVALGDATPSGRSALTSSSSGSMSLASPGISSMRSRRAAVEESKSASSRREAAASPATGDGPTQSDYFDSLSDTSELPRDALPAERAEDSADTSSTTTRRLATNASGDALPSYAAGVPSGDTFDSLGDMMAPPAPDEGSAAAKGATKSYRGPFAPSPGASRRAAPLTDEVERIETSGRKLAIVSVAPYAASVAVVMIILLIALETLPPVMHGSLHGVLTLPAFTVLALFAAGLLFVAGTVRGAWRGVWMAAIGVLPMLFVVPTLFSAPGLAYALLLTLPLIIAISYGAAAAASVYASGPLIKVVGGVSGFLIVGTQVSISLGERGVLQLPGTGEGSPVLFVLALFMGIGPLLNIYNLVNPDEARARLAVIAHWVGYLGIPGLLILVLTFDPVLTMETMVMLLFMFGWVFAAGAGVREILIYGELKQRGYFEAREQDPAPALRVGAVVGVPSAAESAGFAAAGAASESDTKRFGAIPPPTSFTSSGTETGEGDGDTPGADPLPEIPEEGPNLFAPPPEAASSEDDENTATSH